MRARRLNNHAAHPNEFVEALCIHLQQLSSSPRLTMVVVKRVESQFKMSVKSKFAG